MFGDHFYHEKIRKSVAIFGSLFNNLYVVRKSGTKSTSQVRVPLSYAPKSKYLERIKENPDLVNDTKIALALPRMSFEIVAFTYDNTRQLTKVSNFNTLGSSSLNRQQFYSPVPYAITFQLNVYSKTQDDALQIVEQILPTFNPQYTLSIFPFKTEYPAFKEDIPIIIQALSFSDDFEGSQDARRTIVYTLDFEMKVNFYGSIANKSVIRRADADLYSIGSGLADSDLYMQKIRIDPNPLSTIGLADSDFGFTTSIFDAIDSA
tara:strand:- start:583 stop:1371 length:789 start_codon:yes stop_codon:yes gene_type:complete